MRDAAGVLQDIGESEAAELAVLYTSLLDQLAPAVLEAVDLSKQGLELAGVNLKQLVSATTW